MDGDLYLNKLEDWLRHEGMVVFARGYMRRVNQRFYNQGDGWAPLKETTIRKKTRNNKRLEILQEEPHLIFATQEGGPGNLPPSPVADGIVTGFSSAPHPTSKFTYAGLAALHAHSPAGAPAPSNLPVRVILGVPSLQEWNTLQVDCLLAFYGSGLPGT